MRTIQKTSCFLYGISLFLLLSLTVFCSPLPAKDIEDREISLAVLENLINDEWVSAHLIDVWTAKGVVTLRGTVSNILAKERARKIAETVKGVRSVVNRIEVKPVRRDDVDIEWDLQQAFGNDPATELYEIDAKVKDGRVTLNGEVESWAESQLCERVAKGIKGVKTIRNQIRVRSKLNRPDREIEAEIRRRLGWDVWVDDALIDVRIENGRVTLSGKVGSAAEKSRAWGDSWVTGVNAVDHAGLEVDWGERKKMRRKGRGLNLSDAEVEEAVKDALLYDPRVFSFNPEVEVNNGVVRLTGVVDNLKAKRAAEKDSRQTAGVWRVKNYLRVRPEGRASDSQIARSVWDAVARDAYLNRKDISVSVINGKVYLKGAVDSECERLRAEDVASRVKGVVEIENKLVVNGNRDKKKDDWEIKQDIEEELWWDPFVERGEVSVSVEKGVAELRGTVDTWSERAAAEADAYQGGALDVRNHLRVKAGPAYYRTD